LDVLHFEAASNANNDWKLNARFNRRASYYQGERLVKWYPDMTFSFGP